MEQELQQHLSDRIRLRAYEIWMASGANGEAEQHWLAAGKKSYQQRGVQYPNDGQGVGKANRRRRNR